MNWSLALSIYRCSYVSTAHRIREAHQRSAREVRNKPRVATVPSRPWDCHRQPRAAQGGRASRPVSRLRSFTSQEQPMWVFVMLIQASRGSHKGIKSKALNTLMLWVPVLVKGSWPHMATAHTQAYCAELAKDSALLSSQVYIWNWE